MAMSNNACKHPTSDIGFKFWFHTFTTFWVQVLHWVKLYYTKVWLPTQWNNSINNGINIWVQKDIDIDWTIDSGWIHGSVLSTMNCVCENLYDDRRHSFEDCFHRWNEWLRQTLMSVLLDKDPTFWNWFETVCIRCIMNLMRIQAYYVICDNRFIWSLLFPEMRMCARYLATTLL